MQTVPILEALSRQTQPPEFHAVPCGLWDASLARVSGFGFRVYGLGVWVFGLRFWNFWGGLFVFLGGSGVLVVQVFLFWAEGSFLAGGGGGGVGL